MLRCEGLNLEVKKVLHRIVNEMKNVRKFIDTFFGYLQIFEQLVHDDNWHLLDVGTEY